MNLSNEHLRPMLFSSESLFPREGKEKQKYDDACQPNCNPRYGEALRTGHDLADPVLRHVQEQPIQRARTKAHGGHS